MNTVFKIILVCSIPIVVALGFLAYFSFLETPVNPSTPESSDQAIPEREPTRQEINDWNFSVEVIDCRVSEGGSYVYWKGRITSYVEERVTVELILTGLDTNGNIVTFEEVRVTDIYPNQTKYIDRMLDNVPEFDSCGGVAEGFYYR